MSCRKTLTQVVQAMRNHDHALKTWLLHWSIPLRESPQEPESTRNRFIARLHDPKTWPILRILSRKARCNAPRWPASAASHAWPRGSWRNSAGTWRSQGYSAHIASPSGTALRPRDRRLGLQSGLKKPCEAQRNGVRTIRIAFDTSYILWSHNP